MDLLIVDLEIFRRYWNGTEFVKETSGLKVLLFSDDYGYIIAKDFDLNQTDGHNPNTK